ncbi:MAG: hypothetical protein ABIJ65_06905 [Chloroflexota bacterium]
MLNWSPARKTRGSPTRVWSHAPSGPTSSTGSGCTFQWIPSPIGSGVGVTVGARVAVGERVAVGKAVRVGSTWTLAGGETVGEGDVGWQADRSSTPVTKHQSGNLRIILTSVDKDCDDGEPAGAKVDRSSSVSYS